MASCPSIFRRAVVVALALLLALLVASLVTAQGEGPTIVGGQDANPGEWPWQVALVQRNATVSAGQFCGGSLVARDWVLTAAHCVQGTGANQVDVVAGIHVKSAPAPNFSRVHVAEILVHPDYNEGAAFNNDIALLRLATPIDDRPANGSTLPIARIRLVAADVGALVGQNATVTGWGALSFGGATVDTLQEVVVPIIANVSCQEDYNVYGETITANMLCAGQDAGGIDSCQGDSGGPLVIFNGPAARWEQAGIVSWGEGCAAPNTPGVYTRLANYHDWVRRHIAPRIAFVIDDTGSMTQEINDVKTTVNEKVDEFTARALAFEYHLITYKDNVTYRGNTTNPAMIKSWVNALEAEGGGDCPEEMLGALDRLAEEAPHSEAWVLTDAGFHNVGQLPVTIYNLLRADVTVHPIIYDWCFARGGGQNAAGGSDRAADAGGETFAQLASETGGHYFRINSSETRAATDILLNEMTAPSDLMLYRDSVSGEKNYGLDVDATADSLNVMLNLFGGSATMELRDPDGTLISAATPGVEVITLTNVHYVQVTNPKTGHWNARVAGSGEYAVSASGESAIDLEYLGDTTLTNGLATNLTASLSGPIASRTFRLIRPDGGVQATLTLLDDGAHGDGAAGDGVYGGSYTPNTPGSYFLRVTGTTTGGAAFERTAPETIRIHAVRIVAPAGQTGKPGDRVTYQFSVSNNGPTADTFDLSAVSGRGWIETPPPASLALAAFETKQVAVTLRIPGGTAAGNTDELALAATSRTNPLANDVASVVTGVRAVLAPIFLPTVLRIPYVAPTMPLLNGNFEAGHTGWSEHSAQGWLLILNRNEVEEIDLPTHSGVWSAWLGGDHDEIAYIRQQVTVPPGQPFLTYWHGIGSVDNCGDDFGGVIVNDAVVVDQYDLCKATVTLNWVFHSVNLSAYAGQTISLQIRVETNGNDVSSLFVDDVAFSAAARAGDAPARPLALPSVLSLRPTHPTAPERQQRLFGTPEK